MRFLALLLLVAASTAHAIVIRDDVADREHRLASSAFPALADLPGEAHGVLVAPRWVVTAAHAVGGHASLDVIVVGGTPRAVRRVVVHPGFRSPPSAMVQAALASGDWAEFFEFQAAIDDLALIELEDAVEDVTPVPIHQGSALGHVVRIIGRGATGTGTNGHGLQAARRTDLRFGDNRIDIEQGRWVAYTFDAPPAALPREASIGSGDSGGPILLAVDETWQLVGLAAWKRGIVEGTSVFPGRYGETVYGVRLEHYRGWLEATIGGSAPGRAGEPEPRPSVQGSDAPGGVRNRG